VVPGTVPFVVGREVVRSLGQTAEIEVHSQVGMEAANISGSHSLGCCETAVLVHRTEAMYFPLGLKHGRSMCTATTDVEARLIDNLVSIAISMTRFNPA
jgi:hypothetical protein